MPICYWAILLLIWWTFYGVIGWVMVGHAMPEFKSIGGSIITAVLLTHGELSYTEIQQAYAPPGTTW